MDIKKIIFLLLVCGGGAFGLLIHNLISENQTIIASLSNTTNVGLFLISFGLLTVATVKINQLKQKPEN